jgi:hypothetical protein
MKGARLIASQVDELVQKMPGANKAFVDAMVADWIRHTDKTLYDLWRNLTSWASHSAVRGNQAHTVYERSRRVAALLETPLWRATEKG